MRFTIVAALAALSLAPVTLSAHHISGGLTHPQIEKLSANPTPAGHAQLAKQYTMEATAYDQDATEFEAIATASKAMPKIVESCKTGADLARKTAAVYRTMASEHEALAKKK
jgi:hypothetical protein